MNLFVMIFAATLAVVLVAYLLVKYLPLKLRWLVSLLLLVLAAFLGYKIYVGIMAPIKFNKEKKVRFAKVIKNLKIIRDAEVAHFQVTGRYTRNKEGLIQFIDTAKFALTRTYTEVKTVDTGGGITKDIEVRIIDTTGYEPVIKKFKNRDYKNMFKVPGVVGKEFSLDTGMTEKVVGLKVPTFEAKTDKESVLIGMNKDLIRVEKEDIRTDHVKGEFISVGSLEEVTTGGNWPPSYDKDDKKDK